MRELPLLGWRPHVPAGPIYGLAVAAAYRLHLLLLQIRLVDTEFPIDGLSHISRRPDSMGDRFHGGPSLETLHQRPLVLDATLQLLRLRGNRRPEFDKVRVGTLSRVEEGVDLAAIHAELQHGGGLLCPDPVAQAGAAALVQYRSASSPEGIAESRPVVIYARIAFGLPSTATRLARAARLTVEVMQGGRRPKLRLRDWVPAPFDFTQLGGHLHEFGLPFWIAPTRLQQQLGC